MPQPIEAWLGFRLAAEMVERRLGVNSGAAQKLLDKAIESGAIKSRRAGDDPDVWSVDLERLLGEPKDRASRQVELAREAIAAVYPDGKYPPTPQMIKQLGDWSKANCRPAIKRDAILRATGRRK